MRLTAPYRALIACSCSLLVACTLFNPLEHLQSELSEPVPGSDAGDAAVDVDVVVDTGPTVADAASDQDAPDAAPRTYAELVLEDQPLFYLRFDELSGNRAEDSSGNGRIGGYVGGVLLGQPGAIAGDAGTADAGTAATFDGTANQHVLLSTETGLSPDSHFTIEAWVWPTEVSETPFDVIAEDPAFILHSQTNILKFERVHDGSPSELAWDTAGLANDRYTHVVGTYDGTDIRLYVNGVAVDQRASALPAATGTVAMKIGAHFPGSIDEVAFYAKALTAKRIDLHYRRALGL